MNNNGEYVLGMIIKYLKNEDRVSKKTQYVRDLEVEHVIRTKLSQTGRDTSDLIRWHPPPDGWVKINTDGSFRRGLAAAGGLIRDADSRWLGGFTHFIGSGGSVIMAELWGAVNGLHLAWDLGYRMVILEMDSKIIIDWITGQHREGVMLYLEPLMHSLMQMVQWDWQIEFSQTFREGNRCADRLAFLAFDGDLGLQILDRPSMAILTPSLLADSIGVGWLRGS